MIGRALVRLLAQSRIRLPREPDSAADLFPGDRVQISGQLWKVAARIPAEKGHPAGVDLERCEGIPSTAALYGPYPQEWHDRGYWLLVRGEEVVELSGTCVIIFPARTGKECAP